ncbi:MAG: FecR family protein [Nitrospirota bacterium]
MTRSFRAYQQSVLFSVMFAVLLVMQTSAHAAAPPSPIGTVKEIRSGTLERQEKDLWKPLAAGMAIFANDRVRTGSDGLSILALNEVGTILIGPGTEYYMGDPARSFKTLLKRGYLWISAVLAPGRTMSVATANAVTGVRGTKFSVIQDAVGTEVCTCKGMVEVSLRDGKAMNVASGMYGTVDASGKMSSPGKGKPHLESIWKERPARFATCLTCHKKGKKPGDLN